MGQANLTVVTGPARSGKSRWAEHLVLITGLPVTYVATGTSGSNDSSWQERIALHRRRRPADWRCQEVGFQLAGCLETMATNSIVLVDSLGSWVAQGLEQDSGIWEEHCQHLLQAVGNCPANLIVVSEQTGWSVVPTTAIGGLFRDRLGEIEQKLMAIATNGWLVVAGRAIDLLANSLRVPES